MPSGIYIRKKSVWNKNKKKCFTKKTLKKMRKAKLRKPRAGNPKNWKHTQKTKDKIRKANKNNIAWNKGLTKETDIRILKYSKTSSKIKKGQIGVNKGKHWKIKNLRTDEYRQKLREWNINNPNKKFKNTKIEQKIAVELDKRKIEYKQNFGLKNIANVDFFLLKYNIVIECDGDYWHNRANVQRKDKKKTKLLKQKGFKVYRFWEHEINKSPEKCINSIKEI